jgi:hypothetical protein
VFLHDAVSYECVVMFVCMCVCHCMAADCINLHGKWVYVCIVECICDGKCLCRATVGIIVCFSVSPNIEEP